MRKTKFKICFNEYSAEFVRKVCKGKIPTSVMSGGIRGGNVYVHLDAKKCIYASDMIDIDDQNIRVGVLIFKNRYIAFEVEFPSTKLPRHLNFASCRTNSKEKQAGSRSRRPIHGWKKRERKRRLGVGVWP